MPRRAARLTGLGTSVFTEMTALAQRTGAINLGQGFPDTDGPAEVIEAAVAALRGGENQYAPLPGSPRCVRRCWSINGSITAWSPRTCWSPSAPPRQSRRRCWRPVTREMR